VIVFGQFALDLSAGPADAFLADLADVLMAGFGGPACFIVEYGSCPMMNSLLPLSSAFSCVTAWAVVPEPGKKPKTMPPLSELVSCRIQSCIGSTGLEN
jgi:hypothetical protein